MSDFSLCLGFPQEGSKWGLWSSLKTFTSKTSFSLQFGPVLQRRGGSTVTTHGETPGTSFPRPSPVGGTPFEGFTAESRVTELKGEVSQSKRTQTLYSPSLLPTRTNLKWVILLVPTNEGVFPQGTKFLYVLDNKSPCTNRSSGFLFSSHPLYSLT